MADFRRRIYHYIHWGVVAGPFGLGRMVLGVHKICRAGRLGVDFGAQGWQISGSTGG